ncbi:MAG: ribosomal L7Ae/L30e/S12e/Gadd45 family protein [Defluviitaleaceae bacterium]|nr:ribosomal L7Ae/L30e/S12e/Gadd45 family protein [Defluviitaleaceae bacterium]
MDRKISSLLSLCSKAGMLSTGEEIGEKLLQRDEAELVIIASDASDNTKKKFNNKCFYYQKPIRIFGEKEVMSKCVGKSNRTVYVITDSGFAERLQALIDSQETKSTL